MKVEKEVIMENQVKTLLAEILVELFGIDINALPNEARDYPLLSERFGIEPYQMIIFMETVEEKFEIRVPESAIGERKFNTFNDIVKIIIAEKGE